MEDKSIMKEATKRTIFRSIHIFFSIPIIGYIYSPFEQIPNYAPATRFVFVPVLVLSGFWMWKGHVLRRLISKRSAQQDAADSPYPPVCRPSMRFCELAVFDARLYIGVRRVDPPV